MDDGRDRVLRDRAQRQAARERDAVVERREPGDACSAIGSELIGKNVPENRKSGVIPNRKIVANRFGLFWVAANAAIGPANAIPVRTAAGMHSTTSGD